MGSRSEFFNILRRCKLFPPHRWSHVAAPQPFCGKHLARSTRWSNVSSFHTNIHQRPLLHLCHLLIMDHNGSTVHHKHTEESHFSDTAESNKFCSLRPEGSECVCVCVCARFCACVWWASLHMSNWAVPGPRHSSVPRHKASWWGHLLLTVRRSRSPSQQLPRGQTVWAQTPGGTEHGYELSKHTTWSYISSSEYRSHTSPCFCKYLTVREKTPL